MTLTRKRCSGDNGQTMAALGHLPDADQNASGRMTRSTPTQLTSPSEPPEGSVEAVLKAMHGVTAPPEPAKVSEPM